jgi:hypothetical protein
VSNHWFAVSPYEGLTAEVWKKPGRQIRQCRDKATSVFTSVTYALFELTMQTDGQAEAAATMALGGVLSAASVRRRWSP